MCRVKWPCHALLAKTPPIVTAEGTGNIQETMCSHVMLRQKQHIFGWPTILRIKNGMDSVH